jgi:hypothetical protein
MAGTGAIQALKNVGANLGAGEYNKLVNQFGAAAAQRAFDYAKESPNISVDSGTRQAYQKSLTPQVSSVVPSASQVPYISAVGGQGIPAGSYSIPEYNLLAEMTIRQLDGSISKEIEQIRGVTASNVANIQGGYSVQVAQVGADANRYMADRDLEAKRYIADQDYAKAVKVTELQGRNNLDLQAIVNAGLKEVEGIRGQTAKDVATIGGEFGVKQEETRQKGQKDIALIGERSGYRNALISAFSF